MHEIHPNLLWLGNASDVREPIPLFEAGISAVVDLAAEESPALLPRQFIYCRFPLLDGSGNTASVLLNCIQTIVDFLDTKTRTLVACSAGMSRSPVITSFALAAFLGQSPDQVVKRIGTIRSLELKSDLWKDASNVFSQVRLRTGDP